MVGIHPTGFPCSGCKFILAYRLSVRDSSFVLCESCLLKTYVDYDGDHVRIVVPDVIEVTVSNRPDFRRISRELHEVKSLFL